MFDKKSVDKLHKPKRKEAMTELLKNGLGHLQCYRHPKLLLVVHGPEESPESLAFASEPLIGSLVNILSANSADSYDGGGSNRHGSFDLGNQESNRKQPLPNLGSMLQVDYNFIDVEYRYGFSQVCEYYYYVRLG